MCALSDVVSNGFRPLVMELMYVAIVLISVLLVLYGVYACFAFVAWILGVFALCQLD